MKAISIVGFKKTGKTTLAVELAKALSARGLKVGAAKFAHSVMDRPTADTSRLQEVCSTVVGLDPENTAMFWSGTRFLPDLLPLLRCDVLLVEGGKSLGWLPRVVIAREAKDFEALDNGLALASWGPITRSGLAALDSLESLADLVLERGFALAGLDCGSCGRDDCAGLARDIVAGQAQISDCRAQSENLKITVAGTALTINPFIQGLIRSVLVGILGELKGYTPGDKVRVDMKG
ncbi:MAG: molybdopterin-guanine dinucleotide biosynthesis protein MobB [Deltaproteobacteria bacterium]|nr:molybdopterin-guanine dinucleotide biosynthesis protein MobB [Deltaproteobacteria bacterium]